MKKKTEEQSKQEIKASDTRLYQWGYNQAMEDVRVKFAKIFKTQKTEIISSLDLQSSFIFRNNLTCINFLYTLRANMRI